MFGKSFARGRIERTHGGELRCVVLCREVFVATVIHSHVECDSTMPALWLERFIIPLPPVLVLPPPHPVAVCIGSIHSHAQSFAWNDFVLLPPGLAFLILCARGSIPVVVLSRN